MVAGTGVAVVFAGGVVSAGAVVSVVCGVVGAGPELAGAGAGVVSGDRLVPGIIPERTAAMIMREMTAARVIRPHFRRGARLFSGTGSPLPSPGRSAPG